MINVLSGLSEADLIDQGYLIIEHRPHVTTYRPTDKFRAVMRMKTLAEQPCIYETANGTFYKNGQTVRMLGMGEKLTPEVHDGFLEEDPIVTEEMENGYDS